MSYRNIGFPDKNFWKLNMIDFTGSFSSISKSPQMNVILHVLDNLNWENMFIGNKAEVAKATGVCETTVKQTFTAMYENDIFRMVKPGVQMINPYLMVRGEKIHYFNLSNEYAKLKMGKPSRTRQRSE